MASIFPPSKSSALIVENSYTTVLVANIGLFPGDFDQDHPHRVLQLTQDNNTQTSYLSPLPENNFHLPICFLSLNLPSSLSISSSLPKRPSEFNPDHSGRGWEACRGRLPAVGGSGGLSNSHLCDYPAGTVGSVLHPQDAAQSPAHVHLPVWIGKDAPGIVFSSQFWKAEESRLTSQQIRQSSNVF